MKSITDGRRFKVVSMTIESVVSPKNAQAMRRVRNRVRHFMTHNTEKIGYFEQLKWFNSVYWPAVLKKEMIGVVLKRGKKVIGYGLITKRRGRYYVSGGILEEYRGRGHGHVLFNYLTRQAHYMFAQKYVYLDVRNGNENARRLYKKLGYRQRNHVKGGAISMRHPGKAVTIKAQTAGRARKVKVTTK